MGESSPCLLRSFSQPSQTSMETNEGDPLSRALTTSISFGRFVSDSLAWEKWSSFSHNRYLEEVEKYSKPGSVAEMKAYFEAHYKKKAAEKAAASLEPQNEVVSEFSESSLTNEIDSPLDKELGQEESCVTIEERPGEEAPSTELVFSMDVNCRTPSKERKTETPQIVEGNEEAKEEPSFLEKQVESSISLEDAQEISDNQEVKVPIEDARAATTGNHKRTPTSSAMSSRHKAGSRLRPPVKPRTPKQPKNGDCVSSDSRTGRTPADKKRSTPKSLHMSINISAHTGDSHKSLSPVFQKIANSRLVRNFNKTSRESTNQLTPSRASINGVSKHLLVTPQPENRRTKTQLDHSVFERLTKGRKLESTYKNSKPSSTCQTKAQCPIVSSSFSLGSLPSEEMAVKRKELFQKLGQKVNMKEAKPEQLQKQKGNAQHDSKDVRQPVVSQANACASSHPGTKSLDVHIKKVSTIQPCSPRIEKKKASEVLHNKSRPPWRFSMKTDSFKDVLAKSNRPPAYSGKLFLKKSMHENASPNIQL